MHVNASEHTDTMRYNIYFNVLQFILISLDVYDSTQILNESVSIKCLWMWEFVFYENLTYFILWVRLNALWYRRTSEEASYTSFASSSLWLCKTDTWHTDNIGAEDWHVIQWQQQDSVC